MCRLRMTLNTKWLAYEDMLEVVSGVHSEKDVRFSIFTKRGWYSGRCDKMDVEGCMLYSRHDLQCDCCKWQVFCVIICCSWHFWKRFTKDGFALKIFQADTRKQSTRLATNPHLRWTSLQIHPIFRPFPWKLALDLIGMNHFPCPLSSSFPYYYSIWYHLNKSY